MKFDWYQASIPEVPPDVVMNTLSASDYYGEWQETRPQKGYDVGAQFVLGSEVKYRINHGGQNAQYGSNVIGTGGAADELARIIRREFPAHRVSRMDSCEDYHHKDMYRYLRRAALRIAREHKVQVREIVKPLPECDDGRTLYLGAQSSAISMRIYEKGKQLDCGTEWVRAELQVRPQKDGKSIAAAVSAEQAWGMSKWSHAMAVQLGNRDLKRVEVQVYQPSDDERAYFFMLKQYGNLLQKMLATHGSPEAVGGQIFHDLARLDQQPAKASLKPV